jgi:hypothetical protein
MSLAELQGTQKQGFGRLSGTQDADSGYLGSIESPKMANVTSYEDVAVKVDCGGQHRYVLGGQSPLGT